MGIIAKRHAAAPGVFPDCGCHYTADDDGIHFCPLHAAAPDLLAACSELVKQLFLAHEILSSQTGYVANDAMRGAALDAGRAAIAKARGQ